MPNTALNRTTQALLTNKSGGNLNYGDVIVLDNTNAEGFTTTTSAGLSTRGLGVILEPNGIANTASGMVAVGGWVPKVNLNTAATVGQFIKTHTVAGQGTPHSSPQVEGDFAVALDATATPTALLFGSPNGPTSGSSLVLAGASGDLQTNNGAGNLGSLTPGTGVATFIATPSGANLAAALTTALPESKGGTNQTTYTKGDLLASPGTTLNKLGVGSDGTVLTADAASTNGVKWGAAGTGKIVQEVNTEVTTAANGATTIPYDNTIPQNTEGTEFMTLAITPTNVSNKLRIDVVIVLVNSSIVFQTLALFQDTTANALAATSGHIAVATGGVTLPLTHYMTAGTTSATTFKVRSGGNATGTTYFNSHPSFSTGIFGGVCASSITITEIIP